MAKHCELSVLKHGGTCRNMAEHVLWNMEKHESANMVEHVFLNKAQHSGHLGSLWFSSVNTVVHSCLKVLNGATTVVFRSTTVIFGATTVVFGSNTVAYGTMKWHLWKYSVIYGQIQQYLGIIQGCFGHTQW